MKFSNNQKNLTAQDIFEAQQRYQEELMLRLQPVSSEALPQNGWRPGFEVLYSRLSDLDDLLTDMPTPSLVKH
jgi:hypothetical protein